VLKVVTTDRGSVADFQGWAKVAKNVELIGQETESRRWSPWRGNWACEWSPARCLGTWWGSRSQNFRDRKIPTLW